jgi:hypothetical protein
MASIAIAKISPTRQHAIVLFMLTFLHHRTLEVGYLDLRRTEPFSSQWPFFNLASAECQAFDGDGTQPSVWAK